MEEITDVTRRQEGYDKLAALLSSDPGVQCFRRFTALNVKNLLYYQAQIANLNDELNDIIDDDKSLSSEYEEKKKYPFSVYHLEQSLKHHTSDSFQWEKFLELRELLAKYNQALLQQAQLMRFRAPESLELAALRDWLTDKEVGGLFFELQAEKDIWSEANREDLITICRKQDGVDHFTRWIYNRLYWFHKKWGYRSKKRYDVEMGMWKYNDERIKSFTYAISILVSGLLPPSSILVLYFVKDTTARLVVILIYNVIFSLMLGFLVKAKRVEIFAASTAFAAVQVALIANTGGNGVCP
ncbi:hypothetical protein BDV59DRAFT_12675 [Aspergillus ambiguus]|uniref:uncharacterized protein n=1 Tax=Aspergillus ambiguus TaxID=176160 RepID=UPI003CCD75A5